MNAIDTMRAHRPLVQCLTNNVVSNFSANFLLAAGAAPTMCDTPQESRAQAQSASGVLINLGTPTQERYEGMREAIAGANQAGTPWVLDPVAAGVLEHRTSFMREVLPHRPAAIRGNASEILALAGTGSGGRGVDATDAVDTALAAAVQLSSTYGSVVAISGPEDVIVSGNTTIRLCCGDPLLPLVVGTGCALGALTAAYLGAVKDPLVAVTAAHAHQGAAGQAAARTASAPGSFAVALIDALYDLSAAEIADLVSWEVSTRAH
ncbi:hydroxyethylthiazole kinase [Corynebacterium lizhenjunii]|uniref:hydroxyethylthiazole kinase n=1 Tax=Corynebacterium lizhenjunii TaxID=2709394 RepID=UPI0022A7DCF9|nr:hydroxyethylthiazole kinase [Corynebacterium lizhenjunii]